MQTEHDSAGSAPAPATGAAHSPAISFRGTAHRSAKAFRSGTHRAQAPEETFRAIQPYLARAGVTRIADVTGLDSVGVPTTLAIRPNALTIACSSGKGLTLDQACVSGAMEAFELHAAETAILPSVRASHRDLAKEHVLPRTDELSLTRRGLFSEDWPYYWHLGWDLLSQAEVAVPLAMVGMSRNEAIVSSLGAFHVTSNGLGAGNTFLEALASGLYEVIERDAVACHYYAALHTSHMIPVLTDSDLRSYALVAPVLDRCDRADVAMIVYDCTADTHVPTYVAFIYDRVDRGVGVVQGSGSHLDPEIAILRAVTEALQARLNFIAGSRDDIFRSAFIRFRADWRQSVQLIEYERIHSPRASLAPSRATATFEDDIHQLLTCLRTAQLRFAIVVDLTPDDFPVHVLRVLVPGLEGYMHHGYQPGKRAAAYADVVTSTCA